MTCPLIANADVMRLTRVDGCGRPICGDDNAFVFDCFASLQMNANTDDGTDVKYTAANGKVCGFKKGCPSFNGYDAELDFYSVSPELIEIATGNPVVYGFDGRPIGYDDCSIQCNSGFAIELWAEVLNSDACSATGTGDGAWIYFLLPWVTNGLLGDLEVGSEAVTLTLTGATRAGGGWGVGPYDVLAKDATGAAGPLLTPLGSTCHRRTMVTTIAPPEPTCEYVPVTGGLCLAS
ncbi:hypothetical protein [Actinacidiphila sp. ITFR-21]|uniref:hypothetical protein n=1 Tax=Actinacidiphila sp. ITFR-21 TaxID=3075199 RepID=UPI00288B1A5C|nr:hypothetical protein [Streptomyces sp. ITFR-21]WNI20281.1 hypothetical protein RLT57_32970 [Streptomyces sp. ITFR-21]